MMYNASEMREGGLQVEDYCLVIRRSSKPFTQQFGPQELKSFSGAKIWEPIASVSPPPPSICSTENWDLVYLVIQVFRQFGCKINLLIVFAIRCHFFSVKCAVLLKLCDPTVKNLLYSVPVITRMMISEANLSLPSLWILPQVLVHQAQTSSPPQKKTLPPPKICAAPRQSTGAQTLKHGRAQDGRGALQQHALLVGRRPPRAFLPDAGAEGGLRLRAAALHLPGAAHCALLPHPAGPVPQHALVQLDRPHREGHV